MLRIALKTRTTQVPCIVKCCPNSRGSVADEDFTRAWAVDVHPVPKGRRKDARHWCTLDVVDVEKIGSTKKRLNMPLTKFSDRRFNIELGLDAMKLLGLVSEVATYPPPSQLQMSRPAPASQFASANIDQTNTWGSCLVSAPSMSGEFEGQKHLSLAIPEIKIDAPSLDLLSPSYGSTSADDSGGSNWDMTSTASFSFQDDDGLTWSPDF
ncbi:hypothetical protein FZEAL_6545 [Fusarium zealandicum]|uniref:Uncharacterized protein n=1 Tax=Fusarium zealandicum TaxID=1053134 RepID=A0A8H4UID0_9HYPO|nr:hypothetical protein FZEAL_6545 [Fusarium zealandicum]